MCLKLIQCLVWAGDGRRLDFEQVAGGWLEAVQGDFQQWDRAEGEQNAADRGL